MVDDEVSVLQDRRLRARFREVEVELRNGADERLADEVVERLRAAGAGDPDPTSKLTRALGPRATAPPEIDPDAGGSGMVDLVRRALARSVVRLLTHDPGVRLGEDPEAVHQARVATRRLRSDLRTFADVLDTAWSDPLRDELRTIGHALGDVRDLDVLLGHLEEAHRPAPGPGPTRRPGPPRPGGVGSGAGTRRAPGRHLG